MKKAAKYLLLTLLVYSCSRSATDARQDFITTCNEKTGIDFSDYNFEIILDSIDQTEGTLESDYIWYFKARLPQSALDSLKTELRSTEYFGEVPWFDSYSAESWNDIDTSNHLGVWTIDSTLFWFVERHDKHGMHHPAETMHLKIDTVTRLVEMELIHI